MPVPASTVHVPAPQPAGSFNTSASPYASFPADVVAAMRDGQTHHHGPLAGLGVGAAGVLAATLLILVAARRQLGELATAVVWAGIVLLCAGVLYLMAWGFLRLRLHVQHPETLTSRTIPAIPAIPAAEAIETARPAAIEPPRVYLNVTDDQLAAIIHAIPGTAGDDAITEGE